MHAETYNAPGPVIDHDEHPVRLEDVRFAPKQIYAPQAVSGMTEDSQPRRPGGARCAIRGQPQLGFRCFMSTTAAMRSWLGPFGPGFTGRFDEKSRRYFRCVSARCRFNSVDGLKTIA